MTEPGWDIPGVERDLPPVADGASVAAPATASMLAGRGRVRRRDRVTAPVTTPTPAEPAPRAFPAGPAAWPGGPVPPGGPDTDGGALPASPGQALAYLTAGLEFLAHSDPAAWPAGVQADCLRALAAAEARQAAAHAKVLAAFSVPGGGLAGDGHRSPRMWLTWQTQATRRAATAHVARMKTLAAHPVIAAALGGAEVSLSWARQLAEWTDLLPAQHRDDADALLLAAAGRGAGLADLHAIAEDLRREHATTDDGDDGFADRGLRLATTFGGAGRLEGDLTPRCAAAVDAVLGSLAAKRGPEDTRTPAQRQHDALEDACTRLLAAGCLPARAGQPARLELTLTLDELARNGEGSPAGPGVACDAAIQPVVAGHLDHDLLTRFTRPGADDPASAGDRYTGDAAAAKGRAGLLLEQAIALLSGPDGAAARLRRGLGGPIAGVSLPLDIAGTYDTIPVHLRRAVRTRDQHCRFPGCDLPASGCEIHHLIHRKDGGRHALANLALLCWFHHHIAIHRWGWQLTLHPDGTTTAVSPDGSKTFHSHAPPVHAA